MHRGHQCKSGDPCTCVQPRIRNRTRGGSHEQQHHGATASDSLRDPSSPSRTSSQILARIAELRPVLPRPTQVGPIHNPSTGLPHGHSSRHHDSKPYQHTPHGVTHPPVPPPSSFLPSGASNSTYTFNDQETYVNQMQVMGGSTDWAPSEGTFGFDINTFPSPCGCGDSCNCPGCLHHNRATSTPSSSAYASCHNPESCSTCLDCTILSLPSSAVLPPDTALSIYDAQMQNDVIDDWLRQMSSTLPSDNSSTQIQQSYQGLPYHQHAPTGWSDQSNYTFSEQQNSSTQMSAFNFGPSSGQSMMSYNSSNSSPGYSNPPGRPGHRVQGSISNLGPQIDARLLAQGGSMNNNNQQQYARFVDQARSRSPSTSSQSSYHGSDHQGGGGASHPPYRPSGRMQGMVTQTQGLRSMPHLDIRPNMQRGPSSGSSASISPSPGSSGASSSTRGPYASSNPETRQSEYDPSLAGLRLY